MPLLAAASDQPARVAETRVGIYDSRQVAFALFWRPAHQAWLKEQTARAKAAKAAGDQATHDRISRQLREDQTRLHLEVFSTAPVADPEGWLAARLTDVARKAGVARVVSKWDEAALGGVPAAARVDVTDLILQDCGMDAAKRGMLRDIGRSQPLPLAEARRLDAAGQL